MDIKGAKIAIYESFARQKEIPNIEDVNQYASYMIANGIDKVNTRHLRGTPIECIVRKIYDGNVGKFKEYIKAKRIPYNSKRAKEDAKRIFNLDLVSIKL